MPCPHCGREPHDATPPCPHCPENSSASVPAVRQENAQGGQTKAVDPEVLGPGEAEGPREFLSQTWTQNQGGGSQGQESFRFTTWQSSMGGGQFFAGQSRSESCLPGCITLVIAAVLGARLGLLASVGFLVFYGAGSALGFVVTLQRAMRGQQTPPWIRRGLAWAAAALVTVALAGGW